MTAEELKLLANDVANKEKRNLVIARIGWFNGKQIKADSEFLDTRFIDVIRFGLGDAFYGGNVKKLGVCSFMKGCYLCVKEQHQEKVDEKTGRLIPGTNYDYMGMVIDLKEIDAETLLKLGSRVEISNQKEYTDNEGGEKTPQQSENENELPFADEPDEGIELDPHADKKDFVCGVCGKECKSLSGLKKHMTTHK